jgi:small subunit ribosomal protein S7
MPRTGRVKKKLLSKDSKYGNRLVTKFINCIMRSGKKTIAQKHVYKAMDLIQSKTKKEPFEILRMAVENVKPKMEVRPRRVGGAAYQVPMEVRGDRRESLAVRWIISAAKSRPNSQYHFFYEKLAAELIDALNNTGVAIKKKEDTHRLAEANRAFAHFRW